MLFHLFRVHFDSDGQRIQQIYGAAHFTPSVFFFMFANKIKTVYRYNTHKTKTVSEANNKWKCGVWLSVCMRAFGRSFLLAAVNIIIVRSWPGQRFILLLRWVVCCFWLVVCWPYTARLHALFHISNINSLNFNLAIIEMNCILVWYEQLGEKQKSNLNGKGRAHSCDFLVDWLLFCVWNEMWLVSDALRWNHHFVKLK